MNLIDILFPKQCIFCSKVGEDICNKCLTKISISLPKCIVCGRINSNGKIHSKCMRMNITNVQGWDISKKQYLFFSKKKKLSLYSVYSYLLLNLLKRSKLNLEGYKILYIQNTPIDRYLTSLIHSESNSNRICFIGESIPNRKTFLKEIPQDIKEILVISLFNPR